MEGDSARETLRAVLREDRSRGRLRPLESYQRIFNGLEEVVEEEYRKLLLDSLHEAEPTVRKPASFRTVFDRLTDEERPRYTVEGEVGRGGMAVVLRIHDDTLHRDLAMKLIPGEVGKVGSSEGDGDGSDATPAVHRFFEEAQVTAQLDHPGVVPVHEIGIDPDGHIYFTMKLVKGRTLTEIFRLAREEIEDWTLSRALGVLVRVLETLAFAHEKGVIHRDLKPANVMVGRFGEVYVMDWGLAKVLGVSTEGEEGSSTDSTESLVTTERSSSSGERDSPLLTAHGDVLGTPAYMPPEQALGKLDALDARTDVYAAGAMLYELLTGCAPYNEPTSRRTSREVLLSVVAGPPKPIRDLAPNVPPEVAAIADKAMARERSDRYAGAEALARDLRRFLDGRVVRAYRTGPFVELVKWVRRNRALAATTSASLVVVVVLVSIFMWSLATERDRVVEERDRKAEALRRSRALALAQAGSLAGRLDPMLGLLLAHEAGRKGLNPLVARSLHEAIVNVRELTVFQGHFGPVYSASFSPSGDYVLTTSRDATARLWDLEGNQVALMWGHRSAVHGARFSPDGRHVLTWSRDHTARVWAHTGEPVAVLRGHEGAVTTAGFSPDGRLVVTGSADGTARIWGLDGNERAVLSGHEGRVNTAAFSPDGRSILTASADGTARIWDGAGSVLVTLTGHEAEVNAALFSPDGRLVLTVSDDSTARLFRIDGAEVAVLRGHEDRVLCAAFSPDGSLILTGSRDETARLWTRDGMALLAVGGRRGQVVDVSFSPAGDRFVTAKGYGRAAIVWDLDGQAVAVLHGHGKDMNTARFSPRGDQILTASQDREPRLFRIEGRELDRWPTSGSPAQCLALSPSGDRVLIGFVDGLARVFDVNGRPVVTLEGHEGVVKSVAFSPTGDRVLTASTDGTARLWDEHGKETWCSPPDGGATLAAAFLSDGRRVVTGTARGIRTWEAGRPIRTFKTPHRVTAICPSPAGDLLVVAGDDWKIRGWDSKGKRVFETHWRPGVRAFSFHPDGSRFLLGGGFGFAAIWDAAGHPRSDLPGHKEEVGCVEFSRSGERILTACWDQTVRLRDGEGRLLAILPGHGGPVVGAAFTPDGRRVLTLTREGVVRTWLVEPEDVLRLASDLLQRDLTVAEREEYGEMLGPSNDEWIEAHGLVDSLVERLLLVEDARASLSEDRTLPAGVRVKAEALLARRRDDPHLFYLVLRKRVFRPDRSPEENRQALRCARAAHALAPSILCFEWTVAAAHYRLGEFPQALDLLESIEKRRLERGEKLRPEELSFLAMARFRQGHEQAATAALETCRRRIVEPSYGNMVQKTLLREAERVCRKAGGGD